MSSTLDQTNRGPRKTEVLLAIAAYLRPLLEEEKKTPTQWTGWSCAVEYRLKPAVEVFLPVL